MYTVAANSCNWHCSRLSQLLCVQGSYLTVEAVGASPVLPAFFMVRKWASLTGGLPETSYSSNSTMHGGHAYQLLSRKADTKVVRPRSDRGSRYIYKDRSKGTEDQALIPAITFWSRRQFHNTKPVCSFSYKSLTLQDYNNKAPDDELATVLVSCLDIEA